MMIQMVKAALAEASPIQTQLGTEVKRSYLLGNGDMTALIMGNSREFSISITKKQSEIIKKEKSLLVSEDQFR